MRIQKLIFVLFFFCSHQALQSFAGGHAYFVPRSAANNAIRLMMEKSPIIDSNAWITPEYTRSFRANQISRYLFGCAGGVLMFSGSAVANRGKTDILADYFGLSSDFQSQVRFCPVIQNFLVDCGVKFNLDCLSEGLYWSLQAPLVYTNWNLRMREFVTQKGVNISPAGYLSGGNQPLPRAQLVADVITAFQGNATFGDMQDPLLYGKICGKQTRTEIAEIREELGWNFCNRYDCTADVHLFLSMPTGTRTTGEYLFEPIVGNCHHWEIGIGGHVNKRLWASECGEHQWWGFLRANISHLCATHQRRSFDLKVGRGSRYMLLAGMDTIHDDILQIPDGTQPAYQYISHLYPAINKTTFDCRINRAAQADFSLGVVYKYDAWDLNFGYDLWLMSREKLQCRERLASNKFVLKGDAQMYGFADLSDVTPGKAVAVPLSVSQHDATLYAGQLTGNATLENNNADNHQLAIETIHPGVLHTQPAAASAQINGSNPLIFLTDAYIDQCSALAPRASSSMLFLSCQRTFDLNKNWDAFFGVGIDVEFGHSCAALSQFGVWLRAGVSY